MTSLPRALSPLRLHQYRLLAASMTFSLLAAGLWAVALVWQVVALHGGPAALSVVTALGAGGMLASTLLGGALADRIPQRRILLATELVQGTAMAVVASLSLLGVVQLAHLAAMSLVSGLAMGLYYPAYSALVPSLVPEGELLAVNGLEGMIRPVLQNAAGPAAAAFLVAALNPGAALAATATASLLAAVCLRGLPTPPVRRAPPADGAATGLFADVREGFVYMVRTPWLLTTLLFAALMLLLSMGPLEVLVPFAIKNGGGGPQQHAYVLAAFGIGGAVGSLVVASFRLPRRYLTVMNLCWGLGCIPLVVFGFGSGLWLMIAAGGGLGAPLPGGHGTFG